MSREVDRRPATKGGTIVTSARAVVARVRGGGGLSTSARRPAGTRSEHGRNDRQSPPRLLWTTRLRRRESSSAANSLMCKKMGGALGLSPPSSRPSSLPDSTVQKASSGARAVHLQQLYKGITVYGAARTVQFRPAGAITESVGSTVTVAENRPGLARAHGGGRRAARRRACRVARGGRAGQEHRRLR